jgi:hypothetical protein
LTDDALDALATFPRLRWVDISFCSGISDVGLARAAAREVHDRADVLEALKKLGRCSRAALAISQAAELGRLGGRALRPLVVHLGDPWEKL